MKYLYPLYFLLFPLILIGQKASPQLISNAGSIEENSTIKVSWTLGEFSIATIGSNPILTQGVQQSKLLIETKVVDHAYFGKITIFPNPTDDFIIINISDSNDIFKVKLLDLNGRNIISQDFQSFLKIGLQELIAAPYLLQISSKGKLIHVSQIVKI